MTILDAAISPGILLICVGIIYAIHRSGTIRSNHRISAIEQREHRGGQAAE